MDSRRLAGVCAFGAHCAADFYQWATHWRVHRTQRISQHSEQLTVPTFTSDWTNYAVGNFEKICATLKSAGPISQILEIGCHEGRSTCWFLENMLDSSGTMVCVDPFANDHLNYSTYDQIPSDRTFETRFRDNVNQVRQPTQTVDIMVSHSIPALAKLIVDNRQFDFIYVDGNHCADAVMADAVMSFALLRPGGIMLFDDYLWDHQANTLDRPKTAVDAFVNSHIRSINIGIIHYQLGVQKKYLNELNPKNYQQQESKNVN